MTLFKNKSVVEWITLIEERFWIFADNVNIEDSITFDSEWELRDAQTYSLPFFLVENENKNVENNDNDAKKTSNDPKIKDFIAAITY